MFPLSEKTRIEAYPPDLPDRIYQDLLAALQRELTYTFGGCTTIRGLEGHYLSRAGAPIQDRIHVVYSDAPFSLQDQKAQVTSYVESVRQAVYEALNEEAVLIALHEVSHAD